MSKRAKKAEVTRTRSVEQNKEPPRPTLFARIFPILVIIFAVVAYIVTLPEEPTITSSQPHDNNEKSFSRKLKNMTYSIIEFYSLILAIFFKLQRVSI